MGDDPAPCRLRVRLSGDEAALRRFLREHPPGCERAEPEARVPGHWTIEVDVEAGLIPALTSRGLRVDVLYDLAQRGRELRRLVGKGNRFLRGGTVLGIGVPRPKAV